MALTNPAMQQAATTLQGLMLYGQLHSGPAGDGTANTTTAPRQVVPWATPTGPGTFILAAIVSFTGGTPNAALYSITFWDHASGGNMWAELPLTGDLVFNPAGQFQVTAVDFTGSAT